LETVLGVEINCTSGKRAPLRAIGKDFANSCLDKMDMV
jgi:hypothetical protein